jgi:putative transposase
MALSTDIRERVVQAYASNEGGYEALAVRFSIGICSVRRWVGLHKETGSVEKRPHKGRQAKISVEQLPELEALVIERPDRTAEELKAIWMSKNGIELHRSSMLRALQRLKLTIKKRPSAQANGTKSRSSKNASRF